MTALYSTTIPPSPPLLFCCPLCIIQIAGYGVEWTDEAHDNVKERERAGERLLSPSIPRPERKGGSRRNERARAWRVLA